jgi:predicted ATPase
MVETNADAPVFLQRTRSGSFCNVGPSDVPQPPMKANARPYVDDTNVANESKDYDENYASTTWKAILREKGHLSFQREETQLLEFYDERISNKSEKSKLIIIRGPVGCGKSQLAEMVRKKVDNQSGYFLVGHFDPLQFDPPKPYAAFVMAIEAFTTAVINRGEEDAILGDCARLSAEDIGILIGMVPSLERIFGRRKIHETKGNARPRGPDRLGRFVRVFRSFLRCISSETRPIVLLFKSIQWADPCSCDLLDSITREGGVSGLFCIATIDTNAKSSNCMDTTSTDFLRGENVATIELHNLDKIQVSLFVTKTFDVSTKGTLWNEFADMLYVQTQGNFLYIAIFLEMLVASKKVTNQGGQWSFSMEEVQKQIRDASLSSFFCTTISLESQQSLELLKVCACLGSEFDLKVIENVFGYRPEGFLEELTSKGYIKTAVNGYAFAHNCFQEAAYGLIPLEERSLFHVEIGRRLWRSMDSDDNLEANLYTILSQFSKGKHLLKRDKECLRLASLCLQAGQKAAKASAFRAAVSYLELGIYVLMEKADDKLGWKQAYHLTLSLYNAAAEMNLVTSQYERSEQLVKEILLHARSPLDRVQANGTLISIFGTISKQQEAIDVGLKVLEELGESLPKRRLKMHILIELSTVKRMLRGKSDEQLMRLEPLTDTTQHSCLQIMYLIYLHCILIRPELGALVGLRSLKVTLQYGLSPFSISTFAIYGMVCLEMKDVDAAHRFGQLSLKLLDMYGLVEYLPRLYAAHYGVIDPWKRPIKDSLQPLLHAHQIGLHTGDREFSFLCLNCYFFHAFHSGILLDDLVSKWRSVEGEMASSRQESLLKMALPFVQKLLLLMNSSREEALTFKGEIMDMLLEHELAFKSNLSSVATDIIICCMMLAYVFDDFTQAETFAIWTEKHGAIVPTFQEIIRQFFRGLVAFALARQNTSRRKNIRIGSRIVHQFSTFYSLKCPENCCDKQHLLEAELASVTGQSEKAYAHYTRAIALAEKFGFLFEQALIHERFGFHLHGVGDTDKSRSHLRQSVDIYNHWGAKGKARYLQSVISCTISQT